MTEGSQLDAFLAQADAVAAEQPKQPRTNYRAVVAAVLEQEPETEPAVLVRRVMRELGIESSGADAMDDDELVRIIRAGARVLKLQQQHRKQRKEAADA